MDWLAPAASLMGRLRYRNKFLVILALFGLPLAVLAVLLLLTMAERMEAQEARHAGLAQLGALLSAQRASVLAEEATPEAGSDLPPPLANAMEEGGLPALRSALPVALADVTDESGLITPETPAVRYLVDLLADALPRHVRQLGTLGETARTAAEAGHWTPDRFLAVDSALDGAADGLEPVLERARRAHSHEPGWLERTEAATDAYRAAVETFTGTIRQRLVQPDSMDLGPGEITTATESVVSAAADLARAIRSDLEAHLSQRAEAARDRQWAVTLLLAGALALILYLFAGFSASVGRTVRDLDRTATALAAGDLGARTARQQGDELGTVATRLDEVAAGLGELVARVRETATTVADRSGEVDEAAGAVAAEITAQRDALDAVSGAMREATTAADDTARSVQEAADAAAKVHEETAAGRDLSRETAEAMDHLADEVGRAREVIGRLDSGMAGVDGILNVITEVSERTGLLALNAAIEAARAGEHGRGFAVVADEVQELARRTRGSADEIRGEVSRLRETVAEAVSVMERGGDAADAGQERARQSGEALSGIDDSVATISDQNQRVATAAEEQSAIAGDVDRQLGDAAEGVHRAAEAGDRTREAARQTASAVGELRQRLAGFRLEHDRPSTDEQEAAR
jgi:methyl-accepting chemotaxis protein